MPAISAQVWRSSSRSTSVTVLAGVCRISQARLGTGRVRVWCWPPARRTCAVMVSLVLVAVTSVSSSRAMRLRSRIGELLDLELDCVHEVPGAGAWLKVPLGKPRVAYCTS